MRHPQRPKTRGATPTTTEDRLLDCPICSGLQGGVGCPDCDGTGRVSVETHDRLKRLLDTHDTQKVG